MTEIRPIVESESEEFLELLCSVFHLELARAKGIFYTEPFYDLNRKWALFEGKEMISILTTSPLIFGWGSAYGVAGVATRPERQGEGHASKLLERVHQESVKSGESAGLLFAKSTTLYERNGFESLDRVIRAGVLCSGETLSKPMTLENSSVQGIYDLWASAHPDRLRRDARRWSYWHWNYRICEPFQDGYLCTEPGALREAIYSEPVSSLPLPVQSEWFGTTLMADLLEIPLLGQPRIELYLMGRNTPGVPQMFMTDQF